MRTFETSFPRYALLFSIESTARYLGYMYTERAFGRWSIFRAIYVSTIATGRPYGYSQAECLSDGLYVYLWAMNGI